MMMYHLYPAVPSIISLIFFFPIFCLVLGISNDYNKWNINFSPSSVPNLFISETKVINFTISSLKSQCSNESVIEVISENPDIVLCHPNIFKVENTQNYSATFNISGSFMGSTHVKLIVTCADSSNGNQLFQLLPVTVVKSERLIDKLFTISVIILVSIVFLNFGCALNLKMLKESFKKPTNLFIGMISQFLFMPLISYILGKLIFIESVSMRLGLFFTGISPSGGASNIWVCVLGGNINLSVILTALSNLCAFFMMPIWTFSLGRSIFQSASLEVPYVRVASFAVSLVPPLLIGLILQKKCPKFSQLMVKILKPFSSCLIVFIIIFATITNLYLFRLFTGKILLVGLCLPLFGFISSWLLTWLFKRSIEDCLAISVETAVQNTGIAIFMLRLSLMQPEADLTTVVPVAVALMTPFPLLFWYGIRKSILYFNSTERKIQDPTLKSFPVKDKSTSMLINQNSPEQ